MSNRLDTAPEEGAAVRPSPAERLRAVPRRTWWIVGAVAAVLAVVVAIVVATNTPAAPRPGARYPALAGATPGAAADLVTALAATIPEIGGFAPQGSRDVTTKDPDTGAACTLRPPTDDVAAVRALAAAQAAQRGAGVPACLDFAIVGSDLTRDPGLASAGLTWAPVARDGITFVQRGDSPNPRALTRSMLRDVFTCAPAASAYRPVLPPAGSATRAAFLTAVGLPDFERYSTEHPCVTESAHADDGRGITDPRVITPYSVAAYVAQTTGGAADVHGALVPGAVDGVAPVAANPAAPVALAVRPDSPHGSDLTVDQLRTLYDCKAAPATQGRYVLLLPAAGSPVRSAFLQAIGLVDGPGFAAAHPCVTAAPENDGRVLTDPRAIVPFTPASYLAQQAGTAPDRRGTAVLTGVGGAGPVALNPAFPLLHELWTVLPTAALTTAPTSAVFVGPDSAVCRATAAITRLGFAPAPDCGSTNLRTPG
jgi:hypothetical protein